MPDPARVYFRDPSYDGQLVRSLSAAYADAADIGEVFATARRVGRPRPATWWAAWSGRADAARASARKAREAGERVSARNAALRACEYYRQAFYYLRQNPAAPRLLAAYGAHVESFEDAIDSMDCHAEQVRIPYDGVTLKGYFFAPDPSGTSRPTLLRPCGYDSTAEAAEAGWVGVPSALERGYNVLVFEGPGQGEALYRHKLYFRPDFEHVLAQVVDWLLERSDVNAKKLALIGRSFGGYLAPRGATVEHRIAALVCDPAQPTMTDRIPGGFIRRFVPFVVNMQMRFSEDRAEFFGARMACHGLSDIRAYLEELERFKMLDRASAITCPTLIIEADNDFAGGAVRSLLAAMSGAAKLVRLTKAEGADGHCAGLGQQVWEETAYGWLEDVLAF